MKKILLPIISLLSLTSCNYDPVAGNIYVRNETYAIIYCKIGNDETFKDHVCSNEFKPFSQFNPQNVLSINCIDLTNYDITSTTHLHYHVIYKV